MRTDVRRRRGAVRTPGVTLTATVRVLRVLRLSTDALAYRLPIGRVRDGHRELQDGRKASQ